MRRMLRVRWTRRSTLWISGPKTWNDSHGVSEAKGCSQRSVDIQIQVSRHAASTYLNEAICKEH